MTARSKIPLRLAVAACVLLLAPLGMWLLERGYSPAAAPGEAVSLEGWPLAVANWRGAETSLADEVVRSSGADTLGNWLYQNPVGEQVLVQVGVWNDYGPALPHPPEDCYAGAGWRQMSVTETTIPGEPPHAARLYTFERRGETIQVLAWYQCGGATILDREQLRSLRQELRGAEHLPPAVKVMLQTRADDPVRAESRLNEVARLLIDAAPQLTHEAVKQ
jgi:hypothetical protein